MALHSLLLRNSGMFVISSIRCIGIDFIAPMMIRSACSELCLRSDRKLAGTKWCANEQILKSVYQ
jgi:hypothetical protein